MVEIKKVFREEIPAMRFIGKKYHDYSGWGEWFANGWFETIENSMGGTDKILEIWENGGAYVGLECRKTVRFWNTGLECLRPKIQLFQKGLRISTSPKSSLGTCWVYGKEEEVHGAVGNYSESLRNAGMQIAVDDNGIERSLRTVCVPALQRLMKREMLS